MARDIVELALRKHRDWLGYLQPVGLVVTPTALCDAEAFVNDHVSAEHQQFVEHVKEVPVAGQRETVEAITNLPQLLQDVFGWEASDLVSADDPRAANLTVALNEYHDSLRPTFGVPVDSSANPLVWLLLIESLPLNTPLDAIRTDNKWQVTPQARFERLLRETQVPIGLLTNGTQLRLIYAPRGESTGHVTFPVTHMQGTTGRPIFAALHMLLNASRVFNSPDGRGLADILRESRKYQNTVSNELAQQVLAAMFELLRGFQAADAHSKGELLKEVLADDPNQVYGGMLTVLLRLVFVLYAEDRGLMPTGELYAEYYSVTGLFKRLRDDEGRHPDTMDKRYGAWAQLLTLFRLVHDGAQHPQLRLPERRGYLFNPDRYPFLEGRKPRTTKEAATRIKVPSVADGVVFRVLRNLLLLKGERISYRSLDVEQIGSVYETIMGFRLETARGRGIAVKSKKAHGAPVTIYLDELIAVPAKDRGKWLKENADQDATGKALNALKSAKTHDDVLAALDRKIATALTPSPIPAGAMALQPSPERRRSGSHYTPRTLTEPIVRKALAPILKQLGVSPTPEQILALKVCDPAMGSGAFLVEVCRQLADELLKAWLAHGKLPRVPDDETPELLARRIIAQRCLYGVDKNPMAADLAKLSLWLATLAKDHPFTFLDHALKCGDSLVGLTRKQITGFHWQPTGSQQAFGQDIVQDRLKKALALRKEIAEAGDLMLPLFKAHKLALADENIGTVRDAGDLVVAAFFDGDNKKKRQQKRDDYLTRLSAWLHSGTDKPKQPVEALLDGDKGIVPFHWEIEFPEVFDGKSPGFDCFVGNPPFAGKNTIGDGHRDGYLDWLKEVHPESHGNSDLVAHFFRRAFDLLRPGGTFGLIATNTISQGDTRSTGLRWICTNGGTIFAARRRYKWPGIAAVVVSVIHVAKASAERQPVVPPPFDLDGKPVPRITAYLFHAGGHDNPATLQANANKSFQGMNILGMGFTFDDTDTKGVASPIGRMRELIEKDSRNSDRIFPLIGGEELNDSPNHSHHRYVINFGSMSEEQSREWPDLMSVVEERVKPDRMQNNRESYRRYWWQFGEKRGELPSAIRGLPFVLVNSQVSAQHAFAFLASNVVFAHTLNVIALGTEHAFCVLQSRPHEIWARIFASSLEDRLRYTPSDCFETFPFPENFETHPQLEAAGKAYYEFRAELMVRNNEGLTKTYNRFHDPNEVEKLDDIRKLRELHADMDRAVLDAYGWHDLTPTCDFYLDYDDDEDEDDETAAETGKRQRKKPWRYRWPDDVRDEVLARLLELNRQRAIAEGTIPATAPVPAATEPAQPKKPRAKNATEPKPPRKPREKKAKPSDTPDMF